MAGVNGVRSPLQTHHGFKKDSRVVPNGITGRRRAGWCCREVAIACIVVLECKPRGLGASEVRGMFGGAESPLWDAIQYLSLGLIVLWTARLARVKRRNPLIWGGVALLLIVVTETLTDVTPVIGMGPMVALLFLKPPPTAASAPAPEAVTCPKCHAYHASGHSFCVNCGWELSRPYVEDPHLTAESPMSGVVEPPTREAARTVAPAAEPEAIKPDPEEPAPEPEPEAQPVAPSADPLAPVTETPLAASPESREPEGNAAYAGTLAGDSAFSPPEAVAPEAVIPETVTVSASPVFRRPITAAGFTNLGLQLTGEGKFQEAVDQFTKAIALDSLYAEAWAGRAEAYRQLGLGSKADEDERQLQSLPA